MDSIKELSQVPTKFLSDTNAFLGRCTKPDGAEYGSISRAVLMGFLIMGGIGYAVKLIHIPINGILVGGA